MSGADPPPLPRWITHPDTSSNNMGSSILVTGLISLALVVAVVVFLHLYIRFILRRRLPGTGNRATAVDFLRFHAPGSIRIEDPAPHSTGLDPSVIASLPSFLYMKPSGSADEGEDAGGGAAECAVCLSAAEEGEVVRLLPNCKHMFHVDCIDMWLASHVTCPVCRAMVEPPPWAAVDGTGEREASAAPAPLTMGTASHEGTTSSGPKEESSSMSSRLSASLRRMLSARERMSSSSSSRRAHGESTEAPLTTGTASHEGTTLSGPKEESSSMSSRLSASLRRMLSARERLFSSSSSRRAHGESTEDLERQ